MKKKREQPLDWKMREPKLLKAGLIVTIWMSWPFTIKIRSGCMPSLSGVLDCIRLGCILLRSQCFAAPCFFGTSSGKHLNEFQLCRIYLPFMFS